jgi:Ser/Thr protein kinase RdoA (MazF antagonist)
VDAHVELSAAADPTDVTAAARAALPCYGIDRGSRLDLLNVSENATFLVEDGRRGPKVLRVHRLGYHTRAEILSELAWMAALRSSAGISTPKAVPAAGDELVVTLTDPAGGEDRHVVMFELLPGREPSAPDADTFAALGELTARMHAHARSWQRPPGFTRFQWDFDAAFGRRARWGSWQSAPGIGPPEREVLGTLELTLSRRLAAYGNGPERYGLVHADLRLANLLVDPQTLSVIDFDDCGFSWYLYDLATAVSFFEDDDGVPDLIDSWLRGYRRHLAMSEDEEAEIWSFILFRRLLLLAWIGSHREVDIARELGAGYSAASCELADTYLNQYG